MKLFSFAKYQSAFMGVYETAFHEEAIWYLKNVVTFALQVFVEFFASFGIATSKANIFATAATR